MVCDINAVCVYGLSYLGGGRGDTLYQSLTLSSIDKLIQIV